MTALNKDIIIDQGSDFIEEFTLEVLTDPSQKYNCGANPYIPMDFNGYSAVMQVREDYDSPSALLTFTVGDGISLGTGDGKISITILAAKSNTLPVLGEWGEFVYDLELHFGTYVKRVLQGKIIVNHNVTR